MRSKLVARGTRSTVRLTINQAAADYLRHHKAKASSVHTINHYAETLKQFEKHLSNQEISYLEEITPSHLRNVFEKWDGGSTFTLIGKLSDVRAFLSYHVEEGTLAETPWRKNMMVKKPKRILPRVPDVDIEKLMKSLKGSDDITIRNRALIWVFLDSGVRKEEMLHLQESSINLETGAVTILGGKGDKDRITYIGENARKAVAEWLKRKKNYHSKSLWIGTRGDITYSGLGEIVRKIGLRAGVHLSSHKLRRTFATLFLKNGGNIYQLQRMMGHESLEILRKYQDIADSECSEAHQSFSPLDRIIVETKAKQKTGLTLAKRKKAA